jgi:hypothetical protein
MTEAIQVAGPNIAAEFVRLRSSGKFAIRKVVRARDANPSDLRDLCIQLQCSSKKTGE